MTTENTSSRYTPASNATALALVFGGFFLLAVLCWWMDHATLHHGNEALQAERDEVTSERNRLRGVNGTLEASLGRLNDLASSTARSLDETSMERNRLREDRDQVRRDLASLRQELERKNEESQRVARRAAGLDDRVLKLTSAKGDLESRVQSLRGREQDLEARYVTTTQTIAALERRAGQLQDTVNTLEKAVAAEQSAKNEAMGRAADHAERGRDLQARIEAMSTEHATVKARLTAVLDQAERQGATARKEAQILTADLEATRTALAEARAAAAARDARFSERTSELERALDREKAAAVARVQRAEESRKRLATRGERLEAEVAATKRRLEARDSELNETKAARSTDRGAVEKTSSRNDALARRSRDLSAENGDLRRRLVERTAKVTALEKIIGTTQRDREALIAEYVRSQDARRALEGKLADEAKARADLERRIEAKSRKLEELERERKRLEKKLEDVLRSIGRSKGGQ